jgi:hypothetical protein
MRGGLVSQMDGYIVKPTVLICQLLVVVTKKGDLKRNIILSTFIFFLQQL